MRRHFDQAVDHRELQPPKLKHAVNLIIASPSLPLRREKPVSPRRAPREPVGSSGLIRDHCLSKNQKKSAIANTSPAEALNHKLAAIGTRLLAPEPTLNHGVSLLAYYRLQRPAYCGPHILTQF